jgi:hypothetical protein
MRRLTGNVLIRATILLALAAYTVAEWLRFRRPAAWRAARAAWTAGAALAIVHTLAAFHFRHGWSHRDALEATARQTHDVTGLHWGGGLYVNYAFLAVWAADAAWWWLAPAAYARRSPARQGAVAALFLFMFFNGAVVFARGPVRWAGAACVLIAASAWYFRAAGSGVPHARRSPS